MLLHPSDFDAAQDMAFPMEAVLTYYHDEVASHPWRLAHRIDRQY